MKCGKQPYGTYDPGMVDQLAVDFVCNGTRMRLNSDSRVVAVKRMVGRLKTSEIAWRTCSSEREVLRIVVGLGAVKCPVCHQLAFHDRGVFSRHVDTLGVAACPMSGESWAELAVAS